tara:strand:+ start:5404 stop:6663 length:1260 start_codon:yes stop_codon:yes gene_type:complete
MPVTATRVASTHPPPPSSAADGEYHVFARLSMPERDYVRGMRKRERVALTRVLEPRKRERDGGGPVPLRIRVLQSALPPPLRLAIFNKLQAGACAKYLEWVEKALQLPLDVRAPAIDPVHMPVGTCVARARAALDASITGHAVAKCEVLKLVCQARLGGTCASSYALGLEGPPGTGKTHFVKTAMARALGRPLVTIPLGGATDISYLLGSVYTYEGSKEGRLAAALVETGCSDPIVHFDEVDKISTTDRGQEIVSTLIHLVDPSANAALRDRYLHDIDLDFSRCAFVFTYNDPSRVHPVLLDRIKRVRVDAPTDTERAAIVRDHLVPRARVRLATQLDLAPAAVELLLQRARGGMRGVEKEVDHVLATAQLYDAVQGEWHAHDVKLLDAQGRVTGAFAASCLGDLDEERAPPPPLGMYL